MALDAATPTDPEATVRDPSSREYPTPVFETPSFPIFHGSIQPALEPEATLRDSQIIASTLSSPRPPTSQDNAHLQYEIELTPSDVEMHSAEDSPDARNEDMAEAAASPPVSRLVLAEETPLPAPPNNVEQLELSPTVPETPFVPPPPNGPGEPSPTVPETPFVDLPSIPLPNGPDVEMSLTFVDLPSIPNGPDVEMSLISAEFELVHGDEAVSPPPSLSAEFKLVHGDEAVSPPPSLS
jgi:hypothetical protein